MKQKIKIFAAKINQFLSSQVFVKNILTAAGAHGYYGTKHYVTIVYEEVSQLQSKNPSKSVQGEP